MLYRLLKNVNHSSSTFFSLSSRSCHSGTQFSGLREEHARAREGSLPAKTEYVSRGPLPSRDHHTTPHTPRYWPWAPYAALRVTSKTTPLMATRVGRLGSVPGGVRLRSAGAVRSGYWVKVYRHIWPAPRGRWGRPWGDPVGRPLWEQSASLRSFCVCVFGDVEGKLEFGGVGLLSSAVH